jgi:hypothetical protein
MGLPSPPYRRLFWLLLSPAPMIWRLVRDPKGRGRLVQWWSRKVDFGFGARDPGGSGCLGRDAKVWVSLVGSISGVFAACLVLLLCYCPPPRWRVWRHPAGTMVPELFATHTYSSDTSPGGASGILPPWFWNLVVALGFWLLAFW